MSGSGSYEMPVSCSGLFAVAHAAASQPARSQTMNGRGFITISMHELERVKIIEAVVQHRLTIVLAAERLQLCERQVSRLVRRYESAGPAGLNRDPHQVALDTGIRPIRPSSGVPRRFGGHRSGWLGPAASTCLMPCIGFPSSPACRRWAICSTNSACRRFSDTTTRRSTSRGGPASCLPRAGRTPTPLDWRSSSKTSRATNQSRDRAACAPATVRRADEFTSLYPASTALMTKAI
ncbi:helix-turn-helix protein [Paraburkholderia sp. RAU2J]|nr:helix-turn-helix protein [Paraburkholderia sp. RAU2J]